VLNSSEPSLSRTSRSLSGRVDRYNSGFFIKHKRELTSLPVLRYSSGHRKGRLKILYLMKRRQFLKSSIATSALLSLSAVAAKAAATKSDAASTGRQYYELRVYRLKNAEAQSLLDSYLEKAAIPSWNRLGATTVGAFTEIDAKDAAVY